jgi:hypothetical protein
VLEGMSWSGTHLCLSYIGWLYGRGRDGGSNRSKKTSEWHRPGHSLAN